MVSCQALLAEATLGRGLLGCLVGLGFLGYGLKGTPQQFNPFNLWQRPLPSWIARSVYIPLAVVFLYYGVRDLIGALS